MRVIFGIHTFELPAWPAFKREGKGSFGKGSFRRANSLSLPFQTPATPGRGTLGISGWGCAAGSLEPLTFTRASSAEFCYPILE